MPPTDLRHKVFPFYLMLKEGERFCQPRRRVFPTTRKNRLSDRLLRRSFPSCAKNKPVFVVPLHVRCTDGEFLDGEDIFAQDIYRAQLVKCRHILAKRRPCKRRTWTNCRAGSRRLRAVHLPPAFRHTQPRCIEAAEHEAGGARVRLAQRQPGPWRHCAAGG